MTAKKPKFLVLFFFIIVSIGILGYHFWKRSELKRNGELLMDKITSDQPGSKSQWWFNYEFQYKNQVFKSDKSVSVNKLRPFIGKSFPVIFSPILKKSDLLMTPRDFEKYNLSFPDSLSWVKSYVDKNKYEL